MSWKFPGGLLKYTPVEGMTGADRMRIIGATLQDMADGGGGALSSVHDDVYSRIRENQAQSERRQQMRRLFEARAQYRGGQSNPYPQQARGGTSV